MGEEIVDYEVEPLISSQQVHEIMLDCLFTEEEMPTDVTDHADLPEGAIVAEGVIRPFAFHGGRLESHRDEVTKMLQGLPIEFRDAEHGGGGGWSFLNACNDANDVQWTSFHQTMDELFVLGIGLGLAAWLMPRDMWKVLPGGMPYVVVKV